MNIYGLVGHPLSHSISARLFSERFSPSYFNKMEYRLFDYNDLDAFIKLIKSDRSIQGFNVTIPYKQSIIPYLHTRTPEVINTGAANTVMVERKDEQLFLHGHNSDVIGFKRSLLNIDVSSIKHAIILGTGGSSLAVQFVLEQMGIMFEIVSRNPILEQRKIGYQDLVNGLPEHTLVVNCTPVGMYPGNGRVQFPYELINQTHLFYDLIYNPEKSIFLTEAEKRGARIKNGMEMLVEQAKESWKFWGL